jgi:hypothetical protein
MISTLPHYGASWDHEVRAEAGEQKFRYYHALLSGDFAEAADLRGEGDNYPGFFDLNLAVLKRISPFSDFLTTKAFSAMLGFLTLLAAAATAGRIHSREAAFWTVLFLLLYPRFHGHVFINPKDIPFAFGYALALPCLTGWLSPRPPGCRLAVATGLAIGIAMASRIGGLVLFPYLLLFLTLKTGLSAPPRLGETLRSHVPPLLLTTAIAFLVLLAYYPAVHTNPFATASGTLSSVTHYAWDMPVFYGGELQSAQELPRHYILWMFLITAPVPFLLLFFGGTCAFMGRLRQSLAAKTKPKRELLPEALLLFAALFPVAYVVVRDSTLYNGTRHLLFAVPPAAIVAAIAATRFRGYLRRARPRLHGPFLGALGFLLVLVLLPMIRLHPYQYIYYNEIAGGTANAAARYETDYWGTSYRELAHRFSRTVARHPDHFPRPHIILNMEHVPHLFQPFLQPPPGFQFHVTRSNPRRDHFYAANTLWFAHTFYDGPPLLTVSRMDIPLAVIRDRRHLTPEQRQMSTFPLKNEPGEDSSF